ncbi:MAG: cold-shock protein [Anaerolineaceae bacterium]
MGEKETSAGSGDERRQDGQRFRTKTSDGRELQDDAAEDQSSSSDVVEGKKGPNAVNVKLA